MELLALIGAILSIAGVVRFWKGRQQTTEQTRLKFIGKSLSQMNELAVLLERVHRTFTPEYLASLQRDLPPEVFAALVGQVERARTMRGQPGGPSWASVGRDVAMAAIDEQSISLDDVVDITVKQEQMITQLQDCVRPFFRGSGESE